MKKNKKKSILILIILVIAYLYNTLTLEEKTPPKKESQERKTEDVINSKELLNVYFLDVGQADSILLENDHHYMLIDAGNNEDGAKLVTYFKNLGITKFDYVIGTHAHEDHIGGMDDIIKNFEIGTFYMPDVITTTKTFEDVLDALEQKQIAFETPNVAQTFNFNNTSVTTLSVTDNEKDLNNTSIVLKVKYKNTSFLFTGDMESKIESQILTQNIKSNVLKVGHHGSRYSTSKAFLEKVSPTYAVISVGKNNTYNHPNEETLERLQAKNIKVYRTDQNGTIIASSNGTIITFSTINTDTNG